MTHYRVVTQLNANTALPRDVSEVTMAFNHAAGDATSTDAGHLRDDIANFFISVATGATNAIKQYLSDDRDYTANHTHCVFYKIPAIAGPTGPPVFDTLWTLSAPSAPGLNLPEQDAVCLSLHGDLSTAIHPKRHRGRIFVGPLNQTACANTTASTQPQTVSNTFMTDLVLAAAKLKADAAGHGFTWEVWSRVDWAGYELTGSFCDNRFDTQRRRLERPSARVSNTF